MKIPYVFALATFLAMAGFVLGKISPKTGPQLTGTSSPIPEKEIPSNETTQKAINTTCLNQDKQVAALQAQLTNLERALAEAKGRAAGQAKIQMDTEELENSNPEEDSQEVREHLASLYFESTALRENFESAFSHIPTAFAEDLDDNQKAVLADVFEKYFGWENISEGFYKIYTDVYSAAEMRQLISFYNSDLGRMMVERQPELDRRTIALIQKIMEKNMAALSNDVQNLGLKRKPQGEVH